jgi:hypothetical protein
MGVLTHGSLDDNGIAKRQQPRLGRDNSAVHPPDLLVGHFQLMDENRLLGSDAAWVSN